MKVLLLFLFGITIISACDKQGLLLEGEPGGDVAYKKLTKLSLINFNDSTSTIHVDIDNYPLADSFGNCELFLSFQSYNGSIEYGITNETFAVSDTIYKLGDYSNMIIENLSKTIKTDSSDHSFNFSYILIKYNNRSLIISDSLAWQNATIISPFK